MDLVTTLQKSADATVIVARGVRPEQFDEATPCSDWNVQQLMNHLIGSLEYFGRQGQGKDAGRPEPPSPASYEQTVRRLQEAARATAKAWSRPGALQQTVKTGFGDMPGSILASMAVSEMLAHTWDLAKATNQKVPGTDIELDDVLAVMHDTLKPEMRQPSFEAEVPAPAAAAPIERLVAFLGRQP